jgi:nitrate/nitrite-specific signal transduction histidine kinase
VVIDLHHDTGTVHSDSSVSAVGAPKESQVKSTELHIRDDGHGFDTAEITSPGHYGLSMMRERAEAMGAWLNFTSHPGQGTDIYLRWPGTSKQEA